MSARNNGCPVDLPSIVALAKQRGKVRLAIAAADDQLSLHAVVEARNAGIVTPILIGNPDRIRRAAGEAAVDIKGMEVVQAHDNPAAATAAVRMVHDGAASLLMKGSLDTKTLMRAVLSREFGLRSHGILSHIAAFEAPSGKRLVLLTDAGVNVNPHFARKMEILANAVHAAHGLGIPQPKVAILAAVEKVDLPAMRATLDADMLRRLGEANMFGSCLVAGPISLDAALSPDKSAAKGMTGLVAGDADILVAPNIEAANILYKSITCIAGKEMASAVVGAQCPIIVPSRADSELTKMYSIAFAAVLSLKQDSPQ